jgi:hypothetical protein
MTASSPMSPAKGEKSTISLSPRYEKESGDSILYAHSACSGSTGMSLTVTKFKPILGYIYFR